MFREMNLFGRISAMSMISSIGLAFLLFITGGIIEIITESGYIREHMLWMYKVMDILILLSVTSIVSFFCFLIYRTIVDE